MAQKEKSNIYLVAIVAIVAIVGLVVMFTNNAQEKQSSSGLEAANLESVPVYDDEGNVVGQTIFLMKNPEMFLGFDPLLNNNDGSNFLYCCDSNGFTVSASCLNKNAGDSCGKGRCQKNVCDI